MEDIFQDKVSIQIMKVLFLMRILMKTLGYI